MSSTLNHLNIPPSAFGTSGINTANLVYQAVKLKKADALIEYDTNKKSIVIKNLAEVTIKELGEILYSKELTPKYEGWYPKVEDEKDSDGNFLIEFSWFPPHTTMPQMRSDRTFDIPQMQTRPTNFSGEQVAKTKTALSEGVISALSSIMANKKDAFTGVWYPTDLKIFFSQTSRQMPNEYWTGYATEEYFEKISRFTFVLKTGKSASEAVNALIQGPSVLDCGNATQLAYYKAILDVIGPEKFDALFSGDIFRLKITQKGITDPSPISKFSEYTLASRQQHTGTLCARPLSIGEECYFKNVCFYENKHPAGFAGGWNVIYIGNNSSDEQLFIAHGFDSPKSEREIYSLLIEKYNRERTPEEEEYIAQNPQQRKLYDKSSNGWLKVYYTVAVPIELCEALGAGFLVGSCRGLNAELITRALEEEIDEKFLLSILETKLLNTYLK